jgi:hypothetical protein
MLQRSQVLLAVLAGLAMLAVILVMAFAPDNMHPWWG